jgi:hypothetical protein
MTYDPTLPTDLPPPNTGILAVRDNFSQYAIVFANNHVPLNANNQGKHANVILQSQGSDPLIEGSFDTLYSKSVTTTSGISQELFSRIPQFLPLEYPNIPTQLTFNVVNTTGTPFYQSFLPGGYILYFGIIPSAPQGVGLSVQITLVPTSSKILCVIPNPTRLTDRGGGVLAPEQMTVIINDTFQFTINANNPGAAFFTGDIPWIAIAKQ